MRATILTLVVKHHVGVEPVTATAAQPSYDVVVLGTGAAGLTAALAAAHAGAEVGLFEKSSRIGGTTALSGGVVWLPDNSLAREAGVEDSREKALAYLDALSN